MSAFPYLPRMLAQEMFAKLVSALPPPLDDTAETLMARDIAAMSAARGLGPIKSMEEATLVIAVVASDCHMQDALRLAGVHAHDFKRVIQCRSQAMMMLRARHKAAEKLDALLAQRRRDEAAEERERAATEALVADGVAPADAEPAPEPQRRSPEERAHRRAMITAEYEVLARGAGKADSNKLDVIVSNPAPNPVVVAPQADPQLASPSNIPVVVLRSAYGAPAGEPRAAGDTDLGVARLGGAVVTPPAWQPAA